MRIDLYTHYVKVSELDGRGRESLYRFCKSLVEYSIKQIRGSVTKEAKRTYAWANNERSEFRFHINSFFSLKEHLRNCGFYEGSNLVLIDHEIDFNKLPSVEFIPKSTFHTPTQTQLPILNTLTTGTEHSYTVTLQTGKGKTFIALYTMMKLKLRTLINFKGGYLEQWYSVIENSFEFKDIKKQIRVVRGEKDFKTLMHDALKPDFNASIILITYKSLKQYFSDYRYSPAYDYPIDPSELYEKLGIGFRVIDEYHQEFHSNFLHELQTHVYRSLNLSATLDSKDPFKNKMYQLACPKHKRLCMPYDKYIAVTAVYYSIGPFDKIRCMGNQGYSQTAYEDWIFSRKDTAEGYLEFIATLVQNEFIATRVDQQKLLIWAGKVDYCNVIKDYIKEKYPELNVLTYTAKDPESNIINFDICVSTIGSSGTAKDIADLSVVISTTSIDSREANEQMLGRLRRLKNYPNTTPRFYYLNCEQIQQHLLYDRNKRDYFKDKTLSISTYQYPKVIGKSQYTNSYNR